MTFEIITNQQRYSLFYLKKYWNNIPSCILWPVYIFQAHFPPNIGYYNSIP